MVRSSNKNGRGQTALETLFVFTTLIVLAFAIVNLAVLLHTRTIASYAAFMAARSYQVLGDQTGAGFFHEGEDGELLGDLKQVAAIQTADDIFTCAIPWMSVPDGDGNNQNFQFDQKQIGYNERCQSGKRKYEKLNIYDKLEFFPFDDSGGGGLNMNAEKLEEVKDGFAEKDRSPLRYGILKMSYKTRVLFNFFNILPAENDDEDPNAGDLRQAVALSSMPGLDSNGFVYQTVYVPVLLNPGLESGLKNKAPQTNDQGPQF